MMLLVQIFLLLCPLGWFSLCLRLSRASSAIRNEPTEDDGRRRRVPIGLMLSLLIPRPGLAIVSMAQVPTPLSKNKKILP